MAVVRSGQCFMSKVISFRLDEGNPREAQALATIKTRCAQGYRIRSIITEALIRLDESTIDTEVKEDIESLAFIANQVNYLVDILKSGNNFQIDAKRDDVKETELTGNFMDAIKQTAKPGIKLNSGRLTENS